MKNKVLAGLLILGCIIPISFAEASKNMEEVKAGSLYEEVGEVLQKEIEEAKTEIVAQGEDIEVALNEVNIRCELSKYGKATVAEEEVTQSLIEEKSLYEEAVRNGFQVSEEELDKEIAELKKIVELSENSEEIQAMLSKFENEEVYWEYVREQTRISMTIAAYEQSLKKSYCKENNISLKNLQEKEWVEYEEEIIEDLVEEQEIEIVDEMLE